MADQENTPSSNSPQGSINTFNKGMFKDYNETFIGEGLYTHARNGVNNSHDGQVGVIGNEPSNLFCVTLPYTMIGCIHLLDDQWLIFSTNNTKSAVGIFDESACTYSPLKNRNGDVIDVDCLGLKTTHLITGVFRKRYDCERLVYWDDGLNPTRTMDVDAPACILSCTTVASCTTCIDTKVLDCEKIRIAPFIKHPCITIAKGQVAGTLPNGSYQACIAYTINQVRVTDYIGLSSVQGLFTHENTNLSLEITITDIDTTFDEFELVIVSNINAQSVAKRIGYYNTSRGKLYVDKWDTEFVNVPVGDVVFRSEPIEKSDAMYTVNNYLLRIGEYSKFKFNYQPIANQITTNWVAVQYPATYYAKGGNHTSYLRDEQYAFFIRWIYNTGERSESYHIPGRAPIASDTANITGKDAFETIGTTAVTRQVWQVENTYTVDNTVQSTLPDGGIVLARGKMGYWESTETYPSNRADIWDKLCGLPIRHHKMPDETKSILLANNNTNGTNIVLLGVEFGNISHPLDLNGNPIASVVGYEILRGSREGNKSIIGKGLLNNMRQYDIPGNSTKGLFQNYPYNDLRQDPYLTAAVQKGDGGGDPDASLNITQAPFKKNIFSFHSPEVSFSNPYLNPNEVKIYQEMYGKTTGNFEVPYKHPKFKILAEKSKGLALVVAGAIITSQAISAAAGSDIKIGISATQDIPFSYGITGAPTPYAGGTEGTFQYSDTDTATAISTPAGGTARANASASGSADFHPKETPKSNTEHNAGRIENLIAVVIMDALNLPAMVEQLTKIIVALVPKRQYAAQYNSHGFYNQNKLSVKDNRRRKVLKSLYVGSNIQSFISEGGATPVSYQINNIHRSKNVVFEVSTDIDNTSPANEDHSRFTLGSANIDINSTVPNETISSHYGALKLSMPSQYGQLESIKQLSVYSCVNLTNYKVKGAKYNTSTLFGGDVYINRFTEKNTFFFFNDWLMGEPDQVEYDYTAYINVPYPRFWVNNTEKHSFFSLPSAYRVLDRLYVALDSFFVNNGYFYLFNSGVRDFFVESEVNVAYRDYADDIARRHYDPFGFIDLNSMFRSDIIKSGNYYKYDYALSVTKLFNSSITWGETLPRDYNPQVAATCYTYRPNRVIYSLPQQDASKKDNWRIFLSNNFKDFPSKVSSIKPVHKTGAMFMMKYANPQMFMGVEELKLDTTGTKVTIGDGALFTGVQQLQSIINSDESYEYGSNQGRYCSINCLHGVFWVSQNQGKVFQYGGGGNLAEISAGGMRWWFAKYLPSQLLKAFPNYQCYDNAVAGVGVQMIYDNTHELIYITKKDYILKKELNLVENCQFSNGVTVAPDSCPAGYTLRNGMCVPNTPQCPVGYTYDSVQKLCVQVQTSPAINSGTTITLTRTPYHDYGISGALVHSTSVVGSAGTQLNMANAFWGFNTGAAHTQVGQLDNGCVNRLVIWGIGPDGIIRNNYTGGGLDDVPPINTWIGFNVCINIPVEKTYYLAIAGDNYWRITLDDATVPLLIDDRGVLDTFNSLHFYPITLPAGNHILKVEGLNTAGQAGFGCEIFDLSGVGDPVTYLNAQTNYTNLDPLIIFTTRNQTSFTSNLYSCSPNFNLTNTSCNTIPVCQRTLTIAPTYTAIPPQKNSQNIIVPFSNKDFWEEISWTISYDPKIKAWVSFHDWIPSFLIPGRSHFMSVAPQSGSVVDSIWKHNIRCDSYCNYYGVDYPFEIEFVSATGQTVNSMRSIEYLLEAYNYSNDCRDKFHNYYENFDQAIVYNSEQTSGLLRLNLHVKNDPLALLAFPKINTALGYIDIQYSKVENKFRFNQFWDITKNRAQVLPSSLNIPMFNTSGNGYIYPINPAYVNYAKSPLEHKKFRHNVNRVFLRRLVSGSNKFLFKISNQKTLQSPR